MRPLTPDRYRLYLQAMPRVALVSGPIAIALHLHLGPSLPLCIMAIIVGSLLTFFVLACHRAQQQRPEHPFLAFIPLYAAFIFFTKALPRVPEDFLTPGPHQTQYLAHLLRYLSTLLTFHALTLLVITNPTLRHHLSRLWQKLIEVPSRPE